MYFALCIHRIKMQNDRGPSSARVLCVHGGTMQEELAGAVMENAGFRVQYCITDSQPTVSDIEDVTNGDGTSPPPIVIFMSLRNACLEYDGPSETYDSAYALLEHYGLTWGEFEGFTQNGTPSAYAMMSIKTLSSWSKRHAEFKSCLKGNTMLHHKTMGRAMRAKEESLATLAALNSAVFHYSGTVCALSTVGSSAGVNALHDELFRVHSPSVGVTIVSYVRVPSGENMFVNKWSVRVYGGDRDTRLADIMENLVRCGDDYGTSCGSMAYSEHQDNFSQGTGTGHTSFDDLCVMLID